MNGENVVLPAKARLFSRIQLKDEITVHKSGIILCTAAVVLFLSAPSLFFVNHSVGCFAASVGISLSSASIGFYWFTVGKENSYILFWTVLVGMFLGLLALPQLI